MFCSTASKGRSRSTKRLVRDAERAGIPCIGYNFSIAGVWGWSRGPFARGEAISVGLDLSAINPDLPLPDGVVWNMRYRAGRPDAEPVQVSSEELWQRFEIFLRETVPVAEEAGVCWRRIPTIRPPRCRVVPRGSSTGRKNTTG